MVSWLATPWQWPSHTEDRSRYWMRSFTGQTGLLGTHSFQLAKYQESGSNTGAWADCRNQCKLLGQHLLVTWPRDKHELNAPVDKTRKIWGCSSRSPELIPKNTLQLTTVHNYRSPESIPRHALWLKTAYNLSFHGIQCSLLVCR